MENKVEVKVGQIWAVGPYRDRVKIVSLDAEPPKSFGYAHHYAANKPRGVLAEEVPGKSRKIGPRWWPAGCFGMEHGHKLIEDVKPKTPNKDALLAGKVVKGWNCFWFVANEKIYCCNLEADHHFEASAKFEDLEHGSYPIKDMPENVKALKDSIEKPYYTALKDGKSVSSLCYTWFLVGDDVYFRRLNQTGDVLNFGTKPAETAFDGGSFKYTIGDLSPMDKAFKEKKLAPKEKTTGLTGKEAVEAMKAGKVVTSEGYSQIFDWYYEDGNCFARRISTGEISLGVDIGAAHHTEKFEISSRPRPLKKVSMTLTSSTDWSTKPVILDVSNEVEDLKKQVDFHKQEASSLCTLKHQVREVLGVPDGVGLVEYARKLKEKADTLDRIVETQKYSPAQFDGDFEQYMGAVRADVVSLSRVLGLKHNVPDKEKRILPRAIKALEGLKAKADAFDRIKAVTDTHVPAEKPVEAPKPAPVPVKPEPKIPGGFKMGERVRYKKDISSHE